MAGNPSSPANDALQRRIATLENILGLTGARAGGISQAAQANLQPQVFPAVSSFTLNAIQTTSITPVTLASSPTVTALIGSSGDCYVEIGAQITGEATGDQGSVYCYVDGANVIASNNTWCLQGGYGGYTQSASVKFRLSQAGTKLTPEQHTFTLKYAVSPGGAGHSVQFEFNALTITPI